LLITRRHPSLSRLEIRQFGGAVLGGAGNATVLEFSPSHPSEIVAAIGDLVGDGGADMVVGRAAAPDQDGRDLVEVYHLDASGTPWLRTRFAAFDGSGVSDSGNLAVGDVVADLPGDEIVIAENHGRRRAAFLRIFGQTGKNNLGS